MNTQFLKLISIVENWISCSKINESEDDFMKILYVMKFCFAIVGFKEQIYECDRDMVVWRIVDPK